MKHSITILGAYGAKSDKGGSSAFLLNGKNVIDAGNLLVPLAEKSIDIENVWLTHSHLDHISDMAFILDNYHEKRTKTLKIHGLQSTLEALKKHFFNHVIWPDFSTIPLANRKGMCISYHPIECGKVFDLDASCTIEAIRTEHTVPSCGYGMEKDGSGVVITADTHSLTSIIEYINRKQNVKALVVECSFPIRMDEMAKISKHFTAAFLFDALRPLEGQDIKIYINHIKPEYETQISQEIEEMKGSWDVTILGDGDSIGF